ncbi:MAG: VWA domain-containing protein [Candidatus Binatia bacterium]|nr:MAG: VWA domain-containing protein [Candidatus Binatia bacterium]
MTWAYIWSRLTEVSFAVRHPAWLVALVAVVLFVYWGRSPARWPYLLVTLRCLAWCAGVAVLAGLHLRVPLPEQPLTLVALVDRSLSVQADSRVWQDRFLRELDRHRGPTDRLGIVVFAGQPRIARWPQPSPLAGALPEAAMPEGTNLAAALDSALALLPADGERRLVVLSDGHETQGDALSLAPTLRAMGVPVYAAVPPRTTEALTQVAQWMVPRVAPANTLVPVRALVDHRGSEQPALVRLWADDRLVEAQTIHLHPGITPFAAQWQGAEPGAHFLRIEVQPQGGGYFATPVIRSASLSLTSTPRLLFVTRRTHSPLLAAARSQHFELVVLPPETLRSERVDWDGFHAVIWEEPASKVPGEIWAGVQRYVEHGGSLLVAGGESTFGDAGLRASRLADLLPVTFEPRRPPRPEREPLALFLLVDRSNSMGYHIHNRMQRSEDESKLAYARRAALALIRELRDSDSVGVLAFDSQMYEVAPFAPLAENRGLLEHNIARLQPGGGTDFYDALKRAHAELTRSGARRGHVILLTDGDTNRSAEEHEPLLRALEASAVTVTTIRIGDDTVNLEFLQSISARTGGHFYHVRDASELPQLLLQDTSRAVATSPRGGAAFRVRPGQRSQVLERIAWDEAPPLQGYAYTRAKPGAEVLLRVMQGERTDPLLAAWNYGAGRVVVFTSSWSEGAEPWLAWPDSAQFWSKLLRWSLRESSPRDLAVAVQPVGRELWSVSLESLGEAVPEEVLGRLEVEGQIRELKFRLGPEHKLVAQVAARAGERGELTLLVRFGGRGLEERRFVLYFPREDSDSKAQARAPNRALLEALARETGGRVDPAPHELCARTATGQRSEAKALDWVLLPLAMFAFVGEIAARKLLAP